MNSGWSPFDGCGCHEKEFMESFAKQGEIGVTKGSPDLTAYQQQNYGLTTGKQAAQEMDSELEM